MEKPEIKLDLPEIGTYKYQVLPSSCRIPSNKSKIWLEGSASSLSISKAK